MAGCREAHLASCLFDCLQQLSGQLEAISLPWSVVMIKTVIFQNFMMPSDPGCFSFSPTYNFISFHLEISTSRVSAQRYQFEKLTDSEAASHNWFGWILNKRSQYLGPLAMSWAGSPISVPSSWFFQPQSELNKSLNPGCVRTKKLNCDTSRNEFVRPEKARSGRIFCSRHSRLFQSSSPWRDRLDSLPGHQGEEINENGMNSMHSGEQLNGAADSYQSVSGLSWEKESTFHYPEQSIKISRKVNWFWHLHNVQFMAYCHFTSGICSSELLIKSEPSWSQSTGHQANWMSIETAWGWRGSACFPSSISKAVVSKQLAMVSQTAIS